MKISGSVILSVINRLVTAVTGLIVQREILITFGSDVNGLTASISQALSYLALLEAGLGTASIQALYHPLATNDSDGANGILSATKIQYQKTGLLFLLALFGVSLLMPAIVHGELDAFTVGALTWVTGLGNVVSYVFMGKYTTLLTADRKIGVIYCVDSLASILSCVARIAMIISGVGILFVQAIAAGIILLRTCVIARYVRSNMKWIDWNFTPNFNAIQSRWNVLIHQFTGLIAYNTDTVLLTVFRTLREVSIYSVYNYINSNISTILTTAFQQTPLGWFGKIAARSEKEFVKAISIFEAIYYVLLFTTLTTSLLLTLPFIRLYTNGISDEGYYAPLTALLFFVMQLCNLVRVPASIAINSFGWFKETQRGAVIEAAVNLLISIGLLQAIGLNGLLLGTISAFLYRSVELTAYYQKRLGIPLRTKLRKLLPCLMLSIIWILLWSISFKTYICSSWLEWLLLSVGVALVCGGGFLVISILFNKEDYKFIWGMLSPKIMSLVQREKSHKKRGK